MAIKEAKDLKKKTEDFINSADMKKPVKALKSRAGVGRPKKSAAEKLSAQFYINCTIEEKNIIEEKAAKMRMSVSNYIKVQLDMAGVFN